MQDGFPIAVIMSKIIDSPKYSDWVAKLRAWSPGGSDTRQAF